MNILIVLAAALVANLYFGLTEGESLIFITILLFWLDNLRDRKGEKSSGQTPKRNS